MHYRPFGKTGWNVSEISFGAWAIGGSWGSVDDDTSLAAMRRALETGVNFIDTADVYGDGRSERLVAKLLKERNEPVFVATKAGRRSSPHTADSYNQDNLTRYIDRSLKNLEVDALDLVQLHCPPTAVYDRPEVFGILDELTTAGKIKHYGVSVETVDEALKAITCPNVKSVQIIFNLFRTKPAERFFAEAKAKNVAIIARVPLASGMLTGKLTRETAFAPDDHRLFNRHGEAFDIGETFSGVDYETGLRAVDELRQLVPQGATMAQFALRWILMFDAVSCVIPGAKTPQQAEQNAAASELPSIPSSSMAAAREVYDRLIRPLIHHRW